MDQNIQNKIKDKIQEDISPTRNLSGIHLKIVFELQYFGHSSNCGMLLRFHFG